MVSVQTLVRLHHRFAFTCRWPRRQQVKENSRLMPLGGLQGFSRLTRLHQQQNKLSKYVATGFVVARPLPELRGSSPAAIGHADCRPKLLFGLLSSTQFLESERVKQAKTPQILTTIAKNTRCLIVVSASGFPVLPFEFEPTVIHFQAKLDIWWNALSPECFFRVPEPFFCAIYVAQVLQATEALIMLRTLRSSPRALRFRANSS